MSALVALSYVLILCSPRRGTAVLANHPLVQFKRGDHICLFYRDESKMLETLAAYIAAGLNRNEKCFCAQNPRVIPKVYRQLESIGVNTRDVVASGALEIRTVEQTYFNSGEFSSREMLDMLQRSIDDTMAKGFAGFRTAGEMGWALDHGENYCDQLVEYEAMVQAAYPSRPAVGLCQYPAHRFPSEVVDAVLSSHQLALEATMVSSNHSALTLRSGDYVADIVADRMNPAAAFHYVVQRVGDSDVLSWGVEPSIDKAIISSEYIVTSFDRKSPARSRRLV